MVKIRNKKTGKYRQKKTVPDEGTVNYLNQIV